MLQTLVEQHAVGQSCQHVVRGEVAQTLLVLMALRDVAEKRDV
ncbi:hypothetical protein Q8F57_009580 [Paraburkholderia terrae]|nr:hypothetical protein [Paraburkholderia terrae]MDW3662544.1 hypothetical protein [Paraburkholderia terrae]